MQTNSGRGINDTAKEPTTAPNRTKNGSTANTNSMQPLTRTACTRTGTGLAPDQQDVNDYSSSSNNNNDHENTMTRTNTTVTTTTTTSLTQTHRLFST